MEDKIFNFLINYFSNINDRGVDEMNNFRGDITSDEIVEWLKNIQNTSSEQPSEDLEKLIQNLTDKYPINKDSVLEQSLNDYYQGLRFGVIQGANWQKEQDKALIERAEDHAKLAGMALGEKEAKEKFINKACEWLKRCVDVDGEVKMIDDEPEAESFIQKNLHRIEVANQIVKDFKKAMEDK